MPSRNRGKMIAVPTFELDRGVNVGDVLGIEGAFPFGPEGLRDGIVIQEPIPTNNCSLRSINNTPTIRSFSNHVEPPS